MAENRTLCGNCGTDQDNTAYPNHWITVTDWRRDVMCPRCRPSYVWSSADWHILMTHDGRLLGYVRRGALLPGRHVIMHTAFSGDIAGEIVKHHTDAAGEWSGITTVRTLTAVPGYRSANQEYDVGTITLQPVPNPS
jgi:hypothetical protein